MTVEEKLKEQIAQKIRAYYKEGISKARYVAEEVMKILDRPNS